MVPVAVCGQTLFNHHRSHLFFILEFIVGLQHVLGQVISARNEKIADLNKQLQYHKQVWRCPGTSVKVQLWRFIEESFLRLGNSRITEGPCSRLPRPFSDALFTHNRGTGSAFVICTLCIWFILLDMSFFFCWIGKRRGSSGRTPDQVPRC